MKCKICGKDYPYLDDYNIIEVWCDSCGIKEGLDRGG